MRHIGILAGLLALAAIAPGVALAADPVAVGDVVDPADPIGPTVIEPLENDGLGAAGPTRPLTVTAVGTPLNGTALTDGRSVVYDPAGCFTGVNAFTYTMTDGVVSKVGQIIVDVTAPSDAPVTDAPQASFVKGTTIKSTVPVKLSWCGVLARQASLSSYKVYQSTDGGTTYATTPIVNSTATSSTRSLALGTRYAWRATTTDTKGTSAPAASIETQVTRFQESSASIVYSSGWKTASSSKYSGGKEKYVTKKGARATLTVTGVRQFAIVASRASGRGSFNVYVDGVRVNGSAISQKASATSYRNVLYVGSIPGDTSATHTIQVRTTSKARVGLDAILTMSARPGQAVSFATPAPTDATYRGAGHDVAATATSGGPVLLNLPASSWPVCALEDGTLSFHGVGACAVTATQFGGVGWDARTATQSITVAGAPVTITGIEAVDRPYAPGDLSVDLLTANAAVDPADVYGDDEVTVDASGASGAVATAGAGTGKSVTVSGLALAGADAGNYVVEALTITGDITKADQAIAFTTVPGFRVKDGAAYTVGASADSGLPVTFSADSSSAGICTVAGSLVSFPGFGDCIVNADQAGDANWNPAPTQPQGFSVASTGTDPQTITFDPLPDATYGDGTSTLVASASSGLTVTFSSETASVCSVSGTTLTILAAGTCTIEARQAGNPVYTAAAPVERSFTVDPKGLTVSGVTAANRTYTGTTAATLSTASAALVGVVGSDDVTLVTAGATGTFATPGIGNGKTVTVTGLLLGGAKAGSYSLTQPTTTANITRAPLTVTADAKAITYGDAEPAYTFAYSGFVNGETPAVLTSVPSCDAATFNGDAGTWPITCTGGSAANYQLGYVGASLAVAQKPVTVSFTAANRAYNATTTATITGCTLAGTLGGDTVSCSHASATASFATAGVGTAKTVTGTGFTLAGGDGPNYVIGTINTTTANITEATPVCTVTGYTVTYDGSPHSATGSCVGVIAEALAAVNVSGTTRTNAGTYTNLPWTFTDTSGNYLDDAGTVNATINQAAQAITFGTLAAKTYGNAPFTVSATAPGGTVTFSSQSATVCSVSGTTVTLLSGGTCTIRAAQAGGGNYLPAPTVDQAFTVNKATLTVTADDQSVPYDSAPPEYTAGYSGFVGSDNPGGLDTHPTCTSTYAEGSPVATYPITCSGGTDDKYQFSFVAGTLTVTKADQTVAFNGSAPAGATVGGSVTQTATATSGLTPVITVGAGTTNGACTVTGGTTVNFVAAGTCQLLANQAGDSNWNPAGQATRSFTIALNAQSITFDALADREYGDVDTLGASASSGLTVSFASQTASVCTVSGTTLTVVNTGTCSVQATQVGDGTWAAATPVTRSFTATTREITVTAAPDTKVADGTINSSGTPTVTAGSLAAGDTSTFTQAFDSADAGNRTLTPTGTIAKGATQVTTRYAITWASASGTITPGPAASLTLTGGATQTAGTPFTVTVTARDAFGNVATGYTGEVAFSSDDGLSPTLPADTTFTGPNAGIRTFTNGVTLQEAGARTLTVTDTGNGALTDDLAVTVNPGALASITLSPSTATITAGGSQAYTAEGFDAFGNSRGNVTGTTDFSITPDGSCTGASCSATQAGVHTVTGEIGAIDDDATLTVDPGPADTLSVVAGTPRTAGNSFDITVTALDQYGNTATGYTGTVELTSDAPDAMPAPHSFTSGDAGEHVFPVTIAAPGTHSFTATDQGNGSITGSVGGILIQ